MNSTIQKRIDAIQRGETPKGYKKTKWGIIPDYWKTNPFHSLFSRITRRNNISNSNVLTISAQYGLVNQESFFNKSIASENKTNYFLLRKGDFAYNKSYSTGYPFGAIKPLIAYETGIVSPLYICFTPTAQNSCPEFYEHYFESGMHNREIKAIAEEGARNHGLLNMSISDFFNSLLLVPPLPEQEAIAEILTQQDRLIDLKQRLIEEKRKQKKYLMQTLLTGKIRLPGFKGKWKTKTLGELYEFKSSLPIPRSQLGDSGICYLHYGDIHKSNNAFIMVSNNSTNIPRYNISISEVDEKYLLKHGDIVFVDASEDYIGACKYIVVENPDNIPFIAGLHTLAGTNKSNLMDVRFQRYCFQNEAIQKQIVRLLNGMKVYGLSKSTIIKIKVSLPPLPEQEAIAEILSTADEELSLLQRELEQEKLRKKALMQLLLTGLVRVEEL